MSRVVASLLALIAAMFGQALSASTALAATPDSGSVYVFDDNHHTTAPGYTTPERGPPNDSDTSDPTFDRVTFRSHGTSARPEVITASSYLAYYHPALVVQDESVPTRPVGHVQVADGALSSVHRLRVAANAGALEARARSVHSVLDPIAQNSRTTAALVTQEGKTVTASGGRDLSPAQRALIGDGEIIARSAGAHAEVTAVNGALGEGLTPLGIGVSRPICPACITFLEGLGATITAQQPRGGGSRAHL